MSAWDRVSAPGRTADRPDERSSRASRLRERELALEVSIHHAFEDLADSPGALRSYLDDLCEAHPDHEGWILESAQTLSTAFADPHMEDTGADPGALAAEIRADVAPDRASAAAGLALGRARIVEASHPAHRAIADTVLALAGHLGLDPSVVVVDLSADAADIARRAGSVAVALDGHIHLDHDRFDPHSPHGREVLAHEMVHVAQWRLGRDASAPIAAPRLLAEAEASHIGRCFVSGHAVSRPVVPLTGAAPAAFSPGAIIQGALATLAGDLRGRFAESLAGQLEGTIGQPLVPGLRQWGAGALDASEGGDKKKGADAAAPTPASEPAPEAVPQDEASLEASSDDEIAEALGKAGADALVAGGKLTLFFIRAFFAVANKLRLLPRGVEVTAGPIKLFVGGTGSFKEVEFYGRVEIDWAQIMSWLSDLTGQGVGTQPAEGSEGEKKGIRLFGPKKAKVDDSKDFHVTFPWKNFLGGWKASIPPLDVLGYAGWDKGELSMQGLVMHGLRGALPSLPSLGIQWSSGDGAPIDRIVVEMKRLSLGTDNAMEGLHLEPSPANLHFGEWVGLDGITLAGAFDEEKGASFAGRAESVWFRYGNYRVEATGPELAYDAAQGPSASLDTFDVDLDGYLQVHAEGGRIGTNGLDLALLRLPVPRRVQEVFDTLSSIQWTLVKKDGTEVQAGSGIPPLALAWRDLHIGPDGFANVLPSLDPDPADWLFSVRIGETLSILNMSCAIEGVEAWAFEPDAPSPTFDLSAEQATLRLFGATLQGTAASLHVSLDGFKGTLGLLTLGASPLEGLDLEAHMSDAEVSPSGFRAGTIGCGFRLGSEVLGPLADSLGPLADASLGVTLDLLGVSFDATQGLGPAAFGLEAVAIDIAGHGRLELPMEVIKDLLVNGFSSGFFKAFVDGVLATFEAELKALVGDVVELIHDAAEVAEEVIEAAWEVIVAWIPGLTETPPEMGPRDTALARHLGEGALWPEVFAQIESLDDGVGAIEIFDRDLMEEARSFIGAGAIAAGFEKLVLLAQSEDHPSLAFWRDALAAADAFLAAPPAPGTEPADAGTATSESAPADAETTAPDSAPGESPTSTPGAPTPAPEDIDPANHHSPDTFVRSQVKTIPETTAIIDAIYPHFPREDLVIGGYLDDDQQVWKVNFHWEWMLWIIDEAFELGVSPEDGAELRDIQATLRTNPPDPDHGYIPDREMKLKDTSPNDVLMARCDMMRTCKQRLKAVWDRTGLPDQAKSRSPTTKDFHLAAAPVAKSGTSKHGTGMALDIQGDNADIVKRAKELGATLAFDEASHVHVEFMKGVQSE